MLASIIINIVELAILVNNVWTQNDENRRTVATPDSDEPDVYTEMPIKKIYEIDNFNSLFEQHAISTGLTKMEKTKAEKYYFIFCKNLMLINKLYNIYNTSTFSINPYTHFEFDEFTNSFSGFNSTGLTDDDVMLFDRSVVQDLPPVMDWSDNILQDRFQDTSTKCKNSYVLSALSNIEAQYYASNNHMKVGFLSVRQAFECERQGSCEYGGVPHYVFKALKDTGGVSLQHMYPYFDQPNTKGDNCQTSKDNVAIIIDHYVRLKVDKEEDLLYLLAYYGPVVTTIYVSESIRHYSRGVLDPLDCGDNATNHAVLLDGYGVDDTYNLSYWHVKNTWSGWGESGHIRLIRGKGFVCNLGREYITTCFVKPKGKYVPENPQSQPAVSVMRKNIPESDTLDGSRIKETTTFFPREIRTKGIFEEFKFIS